jgi:hypothetical protein
VTMPLFHNLSPLVRKQEAASSRVRAATGSCEISVPSGRHWPESRELPLREYRWLIAIDQAASAHPSPARGSGASETLRQRPPDTSMPPALRPLYTMPSGTTPRSLWPALRPRARCSSWPQGRGGTRCSRELEPLEAVKGRSRRPTTYPVSRLGRTCPCERDGLSVGTVQSPSGTCRELGPRVTSGTRHVERSMSKLCHPLAWSSVPAPAGFLLAACGASLAASPDRELVGERAIAPETATLRDRGCPKHSPRRVHCR